MKFLVSGPDYFQYPESVANALRRLDHGVDLLTYDAWGGVTRKAVARLGTAFHYDHRQRTIERYQRRLLKLFQEGSYDLILLLNPDLLTHELCENAAGRIVIWLIDDIARWGFDAEMMRGAALVASFSKVDAEHLIETGFPAIYLPMAFDDGIEQTQVTSENPVLVGARYPTRETVVWAAERVGLRIDTFGLGWSPSWHDRIREFDFSRRSAYGHPSISRGEAYGLFRGAPVAINIHASQSAGINPRTFEICGSGGVQVVDRAGVAELLEPERELLVAPDSPDELLAILSEVKACPRDVKWKRMRRRGREAVLSKHTYVERCRLLLALID